MTLLILLYSNQLEHSISINQPIRSEFSKYQPMRSQYSEYLPIRSEYYLYSSTAANQKSVFRIPNNQKYYLYNNLMAMLVFSLTL